MEDYKNIQSAVNSVLNVQSFVKKKADPKRSPEKKRDSFVRIITLLESAIVRSNIMFSDIEIDTAKYDERFYEVIDYLLLSNYGQPCYELISFYLWERMDENGQSLSLIDSQGNEINMKSPYDLWDLMVKINPKIK
jgi:hypothetical protein